MSYDLVKKEGPHPIGGSSTSRGDSSKGIIEIGLKEVSAGKDEDARASTVSQEPTDHTIERVDTDITGVEDTGESAESDDLIPPYIPGLKTRGINILKPYIITAMKFIPVVESTNTENSENLNLRLGNDHSIKVNQVLRLIELHRSINKVVKMTSEKIMTQSVISSKQEIINVFENSTIDFRSLYNQIENKSLEKADFLNEIYSMLSSEKMIVICNSLFNNHGFNYKVFRVVTVPSVGTNDGNYYDTILNNAVQKFKDYTLQITNEENLEELNKKMFLYFIKNNENFSNSIQFKKIVEICLITYILKIFKKYILGANSLKQKYSDALDFNILSNEYRPQSTLSENAINISNVMQNVRSLSRDAIPTPTEVVDDALIQVASSAIKIEI